MTQLLFNERKGRGGGDRENEHLSGKDSFDAYLLMRKTYLSLKMY